MYGAAVIRFYGVVAPGAPGELTRAYLTALAYTGIPIRALAIGKMSFGLRGWEALEPLFRNGDIAAAAAGIRGAADVAALRLGAELAGHDTAAGRPTGERREALLATLGAFAATIPEMIVVGRLLAAALPPAKP